MALQLANLQKIFFILTAMTFTDVPVSSLMVHQPPALTVMAGDTAVMVCKFNNKIMWNAKAFWTRNSTGNTTVELDNPQYSERLTKSNLSQTMDGKATMNISDVRVSDADIYYCKIEMADENTNSVKKGKGTGTNLTVLEGQKGGRNQYQTDAASMVHALTWSLIIRSILTFLLITGGLLGCFLSSYVEIRREEEMGDLPH